MEDTKGNELVAGKLVIPHHVVSHRIINEGFVTTVQLHQGIRQYTPYLTDLKSIVRVTQNGRDAQPVLQAQTQLVVIVSSLKSVLQRPERSDKWCQWKAA